MKNDHYHNLSDTELADRLKQGDNRVFKEIYERYWENLINAAFKRLDSIEKAEDLVQNLFVDLYKNRENLQIHTSLEVYLRTAIKRRVFNQFRSDQYAQKYAEHILNNPIPLHENFNNPHEQLQSKELASKIDQALMAVPEKARLVFRLAKIEKRTHREISELLGISVSTIEKHIAKATQILRFKLQNERNDQDFLGIFFTFILFCN